MILKSEKKFVSILKTHRSQKLLSSTVLRKAGLTLSAGLIAISMVSTAHAQQREIINPSFEDVSAVPGLGNGFKITNDSNVPGWLSTNGDIEVWVEGFQNRSAQDGTHLVELNPSAPVGLYQEICVINGCLLYTSPSPRDQRGSRMPSSA